MKSKWLLLYLVLGVVAIGIPTIASATSFVPVPQYKILSYDMTTLWVYYLPIEKIDNTEKIKGESYIHDAIIEGTENPSVRKVIMATTIAEDTALRVWAIEVREPTQKELDSYNSMLKIFLKSTVPARDLAAEIDELKIKIIQMESDLVVIKSALPK